MYMTITDALTYVVGILDELWCWIHDDELQILLGEIRPVARRSADELVTQDPAAWSDWVEAVKKVSKDVEITREVTEDEAKKAIIELMKEYNTQGFALEKIIEHIEKQIQE